MKYKSYFVVFLLFFSLLPLKSNAADTTMVYADQLNHYYMFGGWNHFSAAYNNIYISSNIRNSSSMYSETSRLKTQTDMSGDLLYMFSPRTRAGLTAKYYLFRDGQSSHANDYDQSRFGIKGDYKKKQYTFLLESGYARETRLGIRDMGWYGGMELSRNQSGLMFYPELDWDYSRMGDRRNYTFDNRISFRVNPSSSFKNRFSAGVKIYNREYYITHDADTEERFNTTAYIRNDLRYPLHEKVVLHYRLHFSSSRDGLQFNYYDEKETRTRRFLGLQNDIRLQAKSGSFSGYIGFSNDYKQSGISATNPGISLPADYIFDKKSVLGRLSWRISENDSLFVNYLGSLLYYDTPDTNNYDDRDELTYSISPAWHHRLDRYTRLRVSANVFLHHYVYLFHQRSAQNHWNRIFSIKSEVNTHIPRVIRWNAKQEIYANYFVYDHEDSAFVHVQSMIFRGLKLQQNIQWYLNANWFLQANIFFRFEDNGLLDWEAFIQNRTDSKYTIKCGLKPGYKIKDVSIAAGPVFSYRRDFRYVDLDTREESYYSRRAGGAVSFRYKNNISFSYRLEQIRQPNTGKSYNQSGTLRINWIF